MESSVINIFELLGKALAQNAISIATKKEREEAFDAFVPVVDKKITTSEFITNISYDPSTSVETIDMIDGEGTWQYYNVRPPIAEGLLNAPSKGKYFNDIFKQGFLPYRRIR